MAATLHDVARIAGVSIKTVSNVINDYPHVRPATRARVEAAIDELGYQPNLTARSLRSGRTGAIALALPELEPQLLRRARGCRHPGGRARPGMVVLDRADQRRPRPASSSCSRSPRLQMTDGLIFSPLGMGMDDVARLEVPVPARAARRAHLRRPGRPRDDAQRRGRAGGDRVPASSAGGGASPSSAPTRAR